MSTRNKKNISGILITLSLAVLLSACGGSGGSDSGGGSSSVQGNVTSVQLAMMQPASDTSYSLAEIFKSLLFVKSAHADGVVSGITVDIAGMQTTTNGTGYFMIAGVPPGTHQVQFSKNGTVSTMLIDVGENEQVTMQNISIEGRHSRAQSVSHMSNSGTTTPDNQRGPGMS